MTIEFFLDEGAKVPTKAHVEDAGFDIYLPLWGRSVIVPRKGSATINTGVHVNIPRGYVGFLKSKSGLNVNHGIRGEGVIDAGYTGSIRVKLYNDSDMDDYKFSPGEKISQLVILPIPEVNLKQVDRFSGYSSRGNDGFGSSGKF